tara:strand:+ start:3159 stop:3416 length:258 start_codon:yes stop_codon:yes gene_type:complete
MHEPRSNEDRADSAMSALEFHDRTVNGRVSREDVPTMTSDLITDLCHLLRSEGTDPRDVISSALMHYDAEVCPDDIEEVYQYKGD